MAGRLRVVLDTNIFVAAYYNTASASAKVLERCGEGGDLELCWMPSIRREILWTLRRAGTSSSYQERVETLLDTGHEVRGAPLVEAVQDDPADDQFLACALGALAPYLVTNDHHLLEVGELGGTRILKPTRFLEEVERKAPLPVGMGRGKRLGLVVAGLGLAVMLATGVWMVGSGEAGPFLDLRLAKANTMLLGAILASAGLCWNTYLRAWEGKAKEGAWQGTVLSSLVLALGLGSIIGLPAMMYLALQAGPGTSFAEVATRPLSLFLFIAISDASLLLVVYLRVVRPGYVSWREMGLGEGRLGRGILEGLGTGVFFLVITALIELGLYLAGVRQTQATMYLPLQGASPSGLALVFSAAALLAPFAEEIFFRGYVFRAYLSSKGPVRAYLYSAILFALLHFNLPALLPLFIGALVLTFVYHRTERLLPVMVAHSFNNLVGLLLLVAAT